MALISVLLPVRNAENYLADALESLRRQTLRDIEIVVIDDSSSDSSFTIAREFEEQDERFRLYRAVGHGLVDALNQGARLCRSEIIARMDADDISNPQRLERQYNYLLRRDDVDLVACCVEQITEGDSSGFLDYIHWSNSLLSFEQIYNAQFIESPIVHPSVCFKRRLLKEIGAWRNGGFPEDYELWLRWLSNGVRFEKLPDFLLQWRDSEHRLTRQDSRYSRDAFFSVKTTFVSKWLERKRGGRALYIVGAGRRARKRAGLLLQSGVRFAAWLDVDSRRFGRTLGGVPVTGVMEVPSPAECIVLNYVGSPGAREKIDGLLSSRGFRIGEDFMHIT